MYPNTQNSPSFKPYAQDKSNNGQLVSLGLLLVGAFIYPTAQAAEVEPPIGQINENFRILGDLRTRYEGFDFFQPNSTAPKGSPANNQNDYSFGSIRARLGVSFTSQWLDAFVQGQYTGLYALPEHAFNTGGQGPLGLGGAYFNDSGKTVNPGEVFLRQGYANFKLGKLVGLNNASLKAGRFELNDGGEYKTGDAKFDGIKATRVLGRLIGTFDFSNVARTFDGASVAYEDKNYHLGFYATHPTQGGFNVQGGDEISKIDLAYAAFTAKRGSLIPDAEARLFYIYYGDDRSNVLAVDNRSATGAKAQVALASAKTLSKHDLSLHTLGTHLLGVSKIGDGAVDYLVWGAYQFGDWTTQSHSAFAFATEAGYQFTEVMFKPWLRAGYSIGSGDNNPNDRTHGTFFQVMPTVRLYAKFPFFNMMNTQDAFAQFLMAPTQTTKLGVDFHYLALAETADLFYGGSGATSRSGGFGYYGRKSGGHGSVGELVDISFSHTINQYFSWAAYYGHAFGSDVTGYDYPLKNDADYGYVEVTASF